MSDVVARAKAALEGATAGPWEQNGNNGIHTEAGRCIALTHSDLFRKGEPASKADAVFIVTARSLVPELVAEIERMRTWDGLISLLDEFYPEDIFPTMDDIENRDPGPRILSLIRHLDEARRVQP